MATLNTAELAQLTTLRVQARAGQIGFWQIYEWLGDQLVSKGVPATDSALIWLRGATEANAGRGAMAAIIRTYTETQYQLRYGAAIPTGKMQEASDAVAENLLADLLGDNDQEGQPNRWPLGQVPDIARIGRADAIAVGETLFGSGLGHDENDTAFSQNSAWAGTLLFSPLGSDQTGRLMGTGSGSSIDTLNDMRDVLYAAVAYAAGLKSAALLWPVEGPVQRGRDTAVMAGTVISYLSGGGSVQSLWDTVSDGAAGPVGTAFDVIGSIGPNKFLDMLMGATVGKSQIGTTTDANFASKANTFFNAYGNTLQTIGAEFLPTTAGGIASKAQANTAEGVNARAALEALSVVSVQVSSVTAEQFSLYNAATGQGNITQSWITDRATFTANYYTQLQRGGGINPGGQNLRYFDVASNTEVLVGAGTSNDQRVQYLFGGSNADSLDGKGFADHLYGGAGADTIDGKGGNDYLEGGIGNDTYTFNGSFGNDTILDSDSIGTLTFDGIAMPLSTIKRHGTDKVWEDSTGQFSFTLLSNTAGGNDLRITKYTSTNASKEVQGTVTIKNYQANEFSLNLASTAEEPSLEVGDGTYLAVFGDKSGDPIHPGEVPIYSQSGALTYTTTSSSAQWVYATLNGGQTITTGSGNDRIFVGRSYDNTETSINENWGPGVGQDEDYVFSGDGSDIVTTGYGSDVIYGGDGDDYLYSGERGQYDGVDGTTFYATGSNRAIQNHDEADSVSTDIVDGGAGNDIIRAGMGADIAFGGDGNDYITGMEGDDFLMGGAGADSVYGDGYYTTTLSEIYGNLMFGYAMQGDDTLMGEGGNDRLVGGVGEDQLFGGDGSDQLYGDTDGRFISGSENVLWIPGEFHAADYIDGGNGDDFLMGGGGADVLLGGSGNDTIFGDQYTINPNTGAPLANGIEIPVQYHGNDEIYGGEGDDTIFAGAGSDLIIGEDGNDTLNGEDGDDVLQGGLGQDWLNGGKGSNTYVFSSGDEQDIIQATSGMNPDGISTLQLSSSINIECVQFFKIGIDLLVKINDSSDQITISSFYYGDNSSNSKNPIQRIEFSDGSFISSSEIAAISNGTNIRDDLYGSTNPDILLGNEGDDYIFGLAGNDYLNGGAGNDDLNGGEGDDEYFGGGGVVDFYRDYSLVSNDIYNYQYGDGFVVIEDKGGVDTIQLGNLIGVDDVSVSIEYSGGVSSSVKLTFKNDDSQKIIWTDVFDDYSGALNQNSAFEFIKFSNGTTWDLNEIKSRSIIATSGDDVINLFENDDFIDGGLGNDGINGKDGNDTLFGGAGNDSINGGQGLDQLFGGEGNDELFGMDGDDFLAGGVGDDRLRGSMGDDTYYYDLGNGHDEVWDETYSIYENGGFDTIVLGENIKLSNITDVQLSRGNVTLIFSDGGTLLIDSMYTEINDQPYLMSAIEEIVFSNGVVWTWESLKEKITTIIGDANSQLITGSNRSEKIYGREGGDEIFGLQGDDQLYGEAGNDIIHGDEGNDLISGGLGVDVMLGGAGNDTYIVDSAGDTLTEYENEGVDLVQSSITYTLTANFENLTLTGSSALTGTGNERNNVLIGNSGNNTLNGGVGNDTLDGGSGSDTLVGGAGDDIYIVNSSGDVVTEILGEGMDTVYSSMSLTLTTNVENLILTGTAALNATGNTLANILTGNSGNNILSGGTGSDTMIGGAGNDTYVVDATGDVVTELANEGTDLVQSAVTYTLAANVENLTLTGTAAINGTGNTDDNVLTGNSGVNTLTGNAGNDVLDGLAGADTMKGGTGNDTYYVDNTSDVVTELASEGTDLVQSAVTYTLAVNVENLTLTGTAAINGTGNTSDNVLTGNSGVNTLTGNAGNDVLDGKAGADTMKGGTGNDTYYVDNASDVVTELVSEGTDTVNSSVTLTLAANVENLILTGTAALNATGNTLANILTGNSGNNILSGGTGSDTMIGGAGNDTYVVDATGDVVTELANEGTDLVQSAVTYTLAANVENLTLTGTAAINGTGNTDDNVLTGNSGVNTLTGNAGNDVLDGLAGADTMKGGTGNDTYYVDNASDVVTELASEGADTVISTISYTLGINVENLRINATGALNATGNTADNILYAGAGNNVLNGLGGTDTASYLYASAAVTVSLASASAQSTGGSGSDTLTNMENLEGSNYNDTLTGNTGANVLQGGLGDDTLNGGAGNDTLDGGAGTDTLVGGTGNDTYLLGRGYGSDAITENDATAGNVDMALFGADIAIDQIWLRQVGNNLEVSVIGGSDKITLNSWYLGSQYHVEQFKTSDGHMLTDANVQNLVQAMASFSPPAAGQTTLPSNYQSSLATVIAANWQ